MALLYVEVSHRSRQNTQTPVARHSQYIRREGEYAQSPEATALHAEHIRREGHDAHYEDLVAKGGKVPAWAHGDHTAFWNAAEKYERANGRLCQDIIATLPRELSRAENVALVQTFVAQALEQKGYPHTWGIHETTARDGQPQPHVHIMVSHRQMDGVERSAEQFFKRWNSEHPEMGGARKDPEQSDKAAVWALRQHYSDVVNMALETAGVSARVDPRSIRTRGFDDVQHEIHLGPKAKPETVAEMDRRREERALSMPQEQAQAQRYWEARKIELGITPRMTQEHIIERIGEASRGAIAEHKTQRLAVTRDPVALEHTLAQTQTKLTQVHDAKQAETHYVQHPEQPRTMQHLAAVARALPREEDEANVVLRHRPRWQRDHDEEQARGRSHGWSR